MLRRTTTKGLRQLIDEAPRDAPAGGQPLHLVQPAAPPDVVTDADRWWADCLRRARARNLPVRVAPWDAPEPGSAADLRDHARRQQVENFLKKVR